MELMNKYEAIKGTELVLDYQIKLQDKAAERPALLLLLHGVGSNEADMFRLADEFSGNLIVVAPRAPFVLGAGRFAWFEVDFSSGKPSINEEHAEKSRQIINVFVNQLVEKYAINPDKIFLGGFSQGGIMSYSVGLTYPHKFKGIFAFSSRLLTQIRPMIRPVIELVNLNLFIAHGTQDQTLTVEYAREAKAYLSPLVPKLQYQEYEMPHTIIAQELTDFNIWLAKLL
ncbi:MAG: esterase [Chryseobacterium sp.]|nr:MAG: esterase [Chryseobacterium sp.]